MIVRCPKCSAQFMGPADICPLDGAELVEVPDHRLGMVLSHRYRLDERIGMGGMASVYRATHVPLGRQVAIKILDDRLTADPVLVKRFLREARAANLLQHENIVQIHDLCQERGLVFMVMDLLHGEMLAGRMGDGPMAWREVVELVTPVVRGLERAHALGVIHRDIKPENIFLSREEGRTRVRILDFGIALVSQEVRLTATNQLLGTPEYMSPEQARGQRCSPLSDLYSLGVMMFEMLAGELPFRGTMAELLDKHQHEPAPALAPLAPEVPEGLVALVMRLLEKDPARRPPGADVLLHELERAGHSPAAPSAKAALGAQRELDGLLRAACGAAYPSKSAPSWVSRALDEQAARLDEADALEQQARAIDEEGVRVEERARKAHALLLVTLEAEEAELGMLEGEEMMLRRRMEPLDERAAAATRAVVAEWERLRAPMGEPGSLDPAALDAMEALGRSALEYRAARRDLADRGAELGRQAARTADAERRCRDVREQLAALAHEARQALSELRERAAGCAAGLASRRQAFSFQADALEGHFASLPASKGLFASGGRPTAHGE